MCPLRLSSTTCLCAGGGGLFCYLVRTVPGGMLSSVHVSLPRFLPVSSFLAALVGRPSPVYPRERVVWVFVPVRGLRGWVFFAPPRPDPLLTMLALFVCLPLCASAPPACSALAWWCLTVSLTGARLGFPRPLPPSSAGVSCGCAVAVSIHPHAALLRFRLWVCHTP